MFPDLHTIDWAALQHAYSSAEDVPAIILGLASDDADEREIALDHFLGAVHHQGDVYDSTVASLPFLFELAMAEGRPDRGPVVDLIVGIGEPLRPSDDPDDPEEIEFRAPYLEAEALARARAEDFVALLTDADAAVRAAAARGVALFVADPARAVALLRERLAVEGDIECRLALIERAADVAVREADTAPGLADEVAGWLSGVVAGDADPGTRLAALVHLARSAPDQVVDDVVARAVDLLRAIGDHPDYEVAPTDDRPATPTLVGHLRVMFAPERADRRDQWTADLMRTLNDTLADRVTDRVTLVMDQLRDPDPGRRVDALRAAGQLMRGWRGSYERIVDLIGEALSAPEAGVRSMAALVVEDKYNLVARLANALAEQVAAAGPEAWTSSDARVRDAYRNVLLALARLGDPRAIPALAAVMTSGFEHSLLTQTLALYRDHADEVFPGLRAELAAVPDTLEASDADRAQFLLRAAHQLAAVDTIPDVERVLEAAVRAGQHWTIRTALSTLASFGPALGRVPEPVRALTGDEDRSVALEAAGVCWAVEQDAEFALAWVGPRLTGASPDDAKFYLDFVAELGSRGASLEPLVRPLLAVADQYAWLPTQAAIALVRIAGDVEAALPVFAESWRQNPNTRKAITRCVHDVGPAAASFLPQLQAELVTSRRHAYQPHGWNSAEIEDDEKLLKLCREAVYRIRG